MPFTIVDRGSFTSDGTSKNIDLPSGADYFVTENLTQLATTQATGRGVKFEWYRDQTAADNAIEWKKQNGSNALDLTLVTSGGFNYVESFPEPEAALTGTTITAANPPVCSVANSYSNGDRVRIYGSTGMLQIAGMDFTVSSVSGSDFELAGLDASGFAAGATAFSVRKISPKDPVEPRVLLVTNISQASSAVVTVSTLHNYVVGELVHLNVPSAYGMVEADQMTAKVTAVGNYTLTLELDSSAYSAFAFPTSANAASAKGFASLAPAGSRNIYDVTDVPFQSGQFFPYMKLAAGAQSPAGSSNDVIEWLAFKAER